MPGAIRETFTDEVVERTATGSRAATGSVQRRGGE